MNCSLEKPCRVLNCQFSYFPAAMHVICDKVDDLESSDADDAPSYIENSEEYFMNFFFLVGFQTINGKIFQHAGVSSLTQSGDVSKYHKCDQCDKLSKRLPFDNFVKHNIGCICQNQLNITFGRTIQMVWVNHGKGAIANHPIHLHGHSFHVLKIGYPEYNRSTGLKIKDNAAIDCQTEYCTNPVWKNKDWKNGNIPGLKLKNAPKKDTLMIPTGAYAVIRFKADNPGKWLLHCHIGFHSMSGKMLS